LISKKVVIKNIQMERIFSLTNGVFLDLFTLTKAG